MIDIGILDLIAKLKTRECWNEFAHLMLARIEDDYEWEETSEDCEREKDNFRNIMPDYSDEQWEAMSDDELEENILILKDRLDMTSVEEDEFWSEDEGYD